MDISFNGIGQVCATFRCAKGAIGEVCKVNTGASVTSCADGDSFCGVILAKDGDACTVQLRGFVTVPYTGAAPSVGSATLAANGTGGIKTASGAGTGCLVVQVNTTAKTATIFM